MLGSSYDEVGQTDPPDSASIDADFDQCPQSPALPMAYAFDRDFYKQLNRKLELVVYSQQIRRRLYGIDVAEDYPISHTPIEVKEKYMVRKQATFDELDIPTPEEEEFAEEQMRRHGTILLEPPSPETPTTASWEKHITTKVVPKSFSHTPYTPPSSSEDEASEPVRATPVSKIRHTGNGSSKKRNFAQIQDVHAEVGSCRQRRRILAPRRTVMGVR